MNKALPTLCSADAKDMIYTKKGASLTLITVEPEQTHRLLLPEVYNFVGTANSDVLGTRWSPKPFKIRQSS